MKGFERAAAIAALAASGAVVTKARLRHSIQDLAKTWGCAMFFESAWEAAGFQMRRAVECGRPEYDPA